MREIIWKKLIAIVMVVAMVMPMSGCRKEIEQEDVTDVTYEATELVTDGIQGEISSFLVKNDKLYFFTHEVISEDKEREEMTEVEKSRFYQANLDGSNPQEIELDVEEGKYLSSLAVEENDKFIGMLVSDNQSEMGTQSELIRFDTDGKELLRLNIEEALGTDKDDLTSRIFLDNKGNILLFGNLSVYILNQNLELLNNVTIEDGWQIQDIALAKNGQVVCVKYNQNSIESSTKVCVLDIEKGQWGTEIELEGNNYLGSDYIMNGIDTDIYYKGATGIYSYDIASQESVKLLDYEASYITLEEADRMVPMGEGKFLGLLTGSENEHSHKLMVYSKVDPASLANKQIITYGGLFVDERVKNEIVAFNKTNKDYKIEIKEYIQEEDPVGALNADIIAGNGPDMFQLNDLPVEKYVELGLLENLTTYIEQDGELNTDVMVGSVRDAMKINGNLYYIAPSFSINTVVGRTKDVGDKSGWTFGELKTLLEEKGDSVSLFSNAESNSKRELLYYFIQNGYMDYVNREKGECTFDSKEFKELLKYCNDKGLDKEVEMSDKEYEELIMNKVSRIREGKVLLEVPDNLTVEQVQVNRTMFGEEITYIGYPNEKREGSYFELSNQIGISSKSEVKDKAWEFVRTFMTREYQGKNLLNGGLPTRQDCFDMLIQAEMTTESYTDEFGNVIEPLNHSWDWGGVELQYAPVTQEDAAIFIDLVNNTKKVKSSDSEISDIIFEEAQIYFEGDKELDETINVIQKRVTTYINEQR